MDREHFLAKKNQEITFKRISELHNTLDSAFLKEYQRSVPFNEVFVDRWERAKKLGFGEKTSIYDSSLVLGDVLVGKNCWIGPFTILDGSGRLIIGDFCTISSGVQIYTHDNVLQTLSAQKLPIERESVIIGNNVYIGPNSVIKKGVKIGDQCVIAVGTFVNSDFSSNSILAGTPARKIGEVIFNGDEINFDYSVKE